MRKMLFAVILVATLTACAASGRLQQSSRSTVTLPLQEAWYQGTKVYYISTDMSDPGMSQMMGVNLASRLKDAVPPYPKPPQLKTVLERVYKFPDNDQDSVFGSAPTPVGPTSNDAQYSPLWLVYMVRWNPNAAKIALESEEAVLKAEAAGSVEIVRTDIVVNCPIVGTQAGERLSGASISIVHSSRR